MCDELVNEIELLKAMYSEEELSVETISNEVVKLTAKLVPSTAGNMDMQFSWCELHIHVGQNYPATPPVIELGSSRGLSDAARSDILKALEDRLEQFQGDPVVCMLLEAGREALTDMNGPDGECAICLSALDEVLPVGTQASQYVKLPCYHAFHRSCVVDYCRCELLRQQALIATQDTAIVKILCPECRAEMPWECYSELESVLRTLREACVSEKDSRLSSTGDHDPSLPSMEPPSAADVDSMLATGIPTSDMAPKKEICSSQPEAFVRLHHLWQGNDEKERPLLRLLKELGLNAIVYYGKPALLHIQGLQQDVDSFASTAKRRHITVTIDVAQRSLGPPIPHGITSVPAKKSSLDASKLHEHLNQRGLGETSFTIIGS